MIPNFREKIVGGLSLALLLLLATVSLSTAQEEAQVLLEPLELTDQTLVVGVVAKNVTNLYGAEFKLRYDAEVLAVKDAEADRDGIQV
ncbi:MAG TPA: cohesin domain-containing protein, partial [Anaerolineae bacterium]|nr:cohesin domain-containing protein [Anaerolineae bacterium]